jgi:hypothetical protein
MILTPKNWKSFQHYKDRDPPWIKLHRGLLNNYEFFSLPVASRALAPLLWLIASENEDGKIVTSLDALAFRLHMTRGDLADALSPLVQSGFFEASEAVEHVASATPAVRSPETEAQVKTETNSRSVADATRPSADAFEEFWQSFPRRDGPNPRKPAEQKFNALVKTGVDPAVMIAGAKHLASDEAKRGNIGTRFIPQAVTWLNQQRWSDHAASAFAADEPPPGFYAKFGSEEQDAWDAYGKAKNGKPFPRDSKGGWRHKTQWPPGYVPLAQAHGPPPAPILKSM